MTKTIIVGDFSGIQNYLYNIQKNKSATKRLKGRSVFIEMLLERIKENLKDKLGSCEEFVTSGGKFVLICENFDVEKFNKFKKEIEEKLFKPFYGELKIIFGLADVKNFSNKEKKEFDELKNDDKKFIFLLSKAYEDVERNKLKAFETILIDNGQWNEEMFVFEDDRRPQRVCKFSRGDLIKVKKGYDNYIDDILEEENIDGMGLQTANDIIISNFVAGNKGTKNEIKIFENENLKIDEKYKKYLPKNKDGKIKTFEELAEGGNFNKLAVLKGDIDNLGTIFQFGLKEENYQENYKKLSTILDNFWKKELYKLIGKKDIYVVYAGGDDFVILGRWDIVIKFYKELLEEFKNKIARNQEVIKLLKKDYLKEDENGNIQAKIHFSGAINLFGPHDTFFTVIKQTKNLLKQAKDKDGDKSKNKINIFGQILKNEDFVKLFDEAQEFYKKFVKTDIVSSGTLRFLLDIGGKIKLEKELDGKEKEIDGIKRKPEEYIMWKPHLYYHLARNYSTKNGDSKKDEFRNYIDGMILKNKVKEFKSLSGNDKLFDGSIGEKLIVMISLVLYWKRDEK